jgi:toxin-antitoxin system PIN domain toxin
MMLVDANALIYAVNSDSSWYDDSKAWLDSALVGSEPLGFSWLVILAFWRLSTHPSVFAEPLDVGTAGSIIEAWLSQPAARVIQPTPRHLSVLSGLLTSSGSGANLVNDAHLAALAVEHNATVMTFDSDFARFAGVRHRRPGS